MHSAHRNIGPDDLLFLPYVHTPHCEVLDAFEMTSNNASICPSCACSHLHRFFVSPGTSQVVNVTNNPTNAASRAHLSRALETLLEGESAMWNTLFTISRFLSLNRSPRPKDIIMPPPPCYRKLWNWPHAARDMMNHMANVSTRVRGLTYTSFTL